MQGKGGPAAAYSWLNGLQPTWCCERREKWEMLQEMGRRKEKLGFWGET